MFSRPARDEQETNMANIIACYKWVVNEAEILFNKDLSLDLSAAHYKISDYDRNAIQLAVELAKVNGARPVGLTCGGPESKKSFKDALSRGLEEAFLVDLGEDRNVDGVLTANALAYGVNKIGDPSFIICADASSDVYGRQTGARIAANLRLPYVGLVCKAELNGDTLTCVRKLDGELETVQVQAPAVISILPETIDPIVPGLRALTMAGRKPSQIISEDELKFLNNEKTTLIDDKAYVMVRKNIILEGETMAEKTQALAAALKKEGVL